MKLRKLGNNQTEIQTEQFDILVSYETPVAYYDKRADVYHKTEKKWSATTSRHISNWIPEGAACGVCGQRVLDKLMDADGRSES